MVKKTVVEDKLTEAITLLTRFLAGDMILEEFVESATVFVASPELEEILSARKTRKTQ